MIAIERKKLEQVLDDLICASSYCNTYDAIDVVKEALAQPSDSVETPIDFELAYGEIYKDQRAALAEELAQPEQEPVEDVVAYHSDGTRTVRIAPKRPWVGLTNELGADGDPMFYCGAKWAEAKLKEKNGIQ